MSNNGIPPLNDWQADNYPIIYDEGNSKSYYVKSGNKIEITGGGSSYLVLQTSMIPNGVEDLPTITNHSNTCGAGAWFREDVGYYGTQTTVPFSLTKIIIPGLQSRSTSNIATGYIPIYPQSVSSPQYYFQITIEDNGGFAEVYVNFYTTDGDPIDLVGIDPLNFIFLPEIRFYP